MPHDENPFQRPPRRNAKDAPYEVGYGKPPQETRFKPGRSGNPRGRPKGARNKNAIASARTVKRFNQVILDECYREIGVREGETGIRLPVIQAVVRKMTLHALKGDHRAQRLLCEHLWWAEREKKAEQDEFLKTAIEYKTEWEQRLADCEKHGITIARPYPHPDDIHINMATGEVEIRGPITPDEDDYVSSVELKVSTQIEIAKAEDDLAVRPNSRASRRRLESLRSVLAKLDAALENHPGRGRFEDIALPAPTERDMDP